MIKEECLSAETNISSKQKMLSGVIDYISKNYTTENISVKKLAQIGNVSEVYLRRVFNSVYGTSPLNYINSLRLDYAQSLLKSGEYSVTEVCYMSGFNDISYFSRYYKKYFGISPQNSKLNN